MLFKNTNTISESISKAMVHLKVRMSQRGLLANITQMQCLKFLLIQYVSPIGLSPNELLREERNLGVVGKMESLVSDRLVKTLITKSL